MNSFMINLVFVITLGLFSSFLSIKFGARYRYPRCDICSHWRRICGVETAGELNDFLRDAVWFYTVIRSGLVTAVIGQVLIYLD
jgi:hypothetical protein